MRIQAGDTKNLSMEQNCERVKRADVKPEGLGPACSPTNGWVTLAVCLSVPLCLLICKMGLITIAMR